MALTEFPLISFAPFLDGDGDEQRQTAQQLYDAFHTYGWVYLSDFGISTEEIAEMFAVSATYFSQPLSNKLQNALSDPAINQGYTADGAETGASGLRDHKECYEHRRFRNPNCPSPSTLPDFRPFMDAFYQKCYKLAVSVLRALALIIGLPKDFFDPFMQEADPQLRLLHYMPVPRKEIEADGHARIHPHTDFGLCTILFQDAVGGLEVDPFHTGHFVPATPVPGTCVVNVADLLQRWSNDRLRSTRHRVTTPQLSGEQLEALGDEALLPARYSTAFFVHPSADTMVEPMLMEEGEESTYEAVNAGQWRTGITAKNYSLPIGV